MIAWIIAIMSILFIGFSLGGLFVTKRLFPHKLVFFSVGLLFGFAGYLGMVAGSYLLPWFTGRTIEVITAIVCLMIVGLCIMRYHPTLGYVHSEDKGLWSAIIFLFLLLGMEWGLYEMSRVFVLIGTPLFLLTLLAGATLQLQVLTKMWREAYVAFLPLLWLVFIAIIKMF